jgi:murein DD-endopeptidase MepM/ murein hydrolase activator NlpD
MTYRILMVLAALPSLQMSCLVCRKCPCDATAKAAEPADECADWEIDTSKWKFRDDRPDLPIGMECLLDPLAQKASSFRVNSPFRDPDHCWAPGRHGAIDISAAAGTPVVAPAGGMVVRVLEEHDEAWSVDVVFGVFWVFSVTHLREIAVEEGETVRTGQVLGWSGGEKGQPGSGPYTTGAHLHFSMQYDGAFVDPEKYLCRTYPRGKGKPSCPKRPAHCKQAP